MVRYLLLICGLFFVFNPSAAQVAVVEPSTFEQGANFGYSIAQDGNWLLVGAKKDTITEVSSGAAYFFKWENGEWIEWQKVGPQPVSASGYFGNSVAIFGNYAVVGANGDDSNGLNSGAAYIFRFNGDIWEMSQKLLPQSEGIGSDEFGVAVDMNDSLLVVGAYSDFTNGPFSGSAYIYRLDHQEWSLSSKVFASDATADDKFGRSVATDGRKVIVCGVLNDDLGTNSGSAYIFSEVNNRWEEEEKLLAPDGAENDRFGRSVDIDFNVATVGAVLDDDNGEQSGSVYIFKNGSNGWELQSKITPKDGAADDFFGYSLSFRPPYLLVGAHNDDDLGLNSGSAYLFQLQGHDWIEIEKIHSLNGLEGDNFGESVVINESFISIGAPFAYKADIRTGNTMIFNSPIVASLEQPTTVRLTLYPNPASTEISLEGIGASEIVNISAYDVHGRSYLLPVVSKEKVVVDVSILTEGIYLLHIELGHNTYSHRVVLRR
jgi:hypothetical protein